MRSEWRIWPTRIERTWRTEDGGRALVVFDATGDRVAQDDGTWFPREFTYVEIPQDDAAPYYLVECEHDDDLVPRVLAVHVVRSPQRREVVSADLQRLRLEPVLEQALWKSHSRPAVVTDDHATERTLVDSVRHRQEVKRTIRGLRSRARQKITGRLLDEVAQVYRDNLDTGAPTKAVRDHFGLPASTASLYVKRARDSGRDLGDGDAAGTTSKGGATTNGRRRASPASRGRARASHAHETDGPPNQRS